MTIHGSDGTIENHMIFVYARPGYGKSLQVEGIMEQYRKAGYVVMILSDVKDEFESAFAMFPASKYYHVNLLRRIGKPIETTPVKIYHPFTFRIPTNTYLPDINFYGFSLKDLGRSEWGMLAESAFESDTIRILLNAVENISSTDGLYSFLHSIEETVLGKKERRSLKPDPKNFFLRTTPATGKSLQDVSSYLLPFKKDYFLLPEASPLKLDWKTILNDQSCYHFFTSYWIKDEKLKQFCILALFNQILRNKRYAKKPILIVIPEIRRLVPFKPEGYKKFLAETIKDNLSVMRNMGRGMSGLFDSQIWNDVDEDVRNTATRTFFGEMGGAGDIEKLSKAMNYKREVRDLLKNMPYRNSYLWQGREDQESITFWLPGHAHKEPEYNFFEEYRKFFPEAQKNYSSLVETMKKFYQEEIDGIKAKIKRRAKEEQELEEEKQKAREPKGKDEEIEKLKEKTKNIEVNSKEEKKRLIYEDKVKDPNLSFRDIAKKYKIHHLTVKQYFEEYKAKMENKQQEETKKDFQDKVLEDLNKDKNPKNNVEDQKTDSNDQPLE